MNINIQKLNISVNVAIALNELLSAGNYKVKEWGGRSDPTVGHFFDFYLEKDSQTIDALEAFGILKVSCRDVTIDMAEDIKRLEKENKVHSATMRETKKAAVAYFVKAEIDDDTLDDYNKFAFAKSEIFANNILIERYKKNYPKTQKEWSVSLAPEGIELLKNGSISIKLGA